jgi:putative ABC transport system permease protein
MLAFVVLYNLTNINIQERKTEIATIKVLGFYPKEVYDYVFRENIFIAVIGSILGILFGYLLHGYLIRVVEIDLTHFIHSAGVMSYIYAVIITMVFTYLINFYMRRVLRKIDMVESLKSIE